MSATLTPPGTTRAPAARHGVRPLARTSGWGPAVRIARRDMAANRGRSALAVVMLALPVVLSFALTVLTASYEQNAMERLSAQTGSASASLGDSRTASVRQQASGMVTGYGEPRLPLTEQQVTAVLPGARLVAVREVALSIAPRGWDGDLPDLAPLLTTALDTSEPATQGMHRLLEGRLPRTADEVALTPGAARLAGAEVDGTVTLGTLDEEGLVVGSRDARVVGIAVARGEAPRDVGALVQPGALDAAQLAAQPSRWLLDRVEPVSAEEFEALNGIGVVVSSVDVLLDPPPTAEPERRAGLGARATVFAAAVVLVVLEVVLLAAPAFAVGVRQQREDLTLLAATGADAGALRRVVLAHAVLVAAVAVAVGLVVGVAGTVLGLVLGYGWLPGARGPVEVPWSWVAAVGGTGVLAALLAAWFPARTAARTDVAAGLAGRGGVTGVPWRRACAGVVVLAVGAGLTWVSGDPGRGTVLGLVGGILLCTAGTLLMVPLLVAGLAPLGSHLPLPLRLACRDAARSAGRSVAAVAAVASVVGGLTALGTYGLSAVAFDRSTYQPSLAVDRTLVGHQTEDPYDVSELRRALPPGFDVLPLGYPGGQVGDQDAYRGLFIASQGCLDPEDPADHWAGCGQDQSGWVDVSSAVVAAETAVLEGLGFELSPEERGALESGEVLLVGEGVQALRADGTIRVTAFTTVVDEAASGQAASSTAEPSVDVPARQYGGQPEPLSQRSNPLVLMLPATAERLAGFSSSDALVVGARALTPAEEETLSDVDSVFTVYTERGYRLPEVDPVVLGVVIAAVLALVVGTLTAAALALVDARPVQRVLGDVGASGRTRRLVAGGTAAVVAAAGAVAGTVMGLGPGAALARMSTSGYWDVERGLRVAVDPTVVPAWPVTLVTVLLVPLLLGGLMALVARPDGAGRSGRSTRPGRSRAS